MSSISIIIPCFNEEANLKRGVLNSVSQYLSKQKFTYEVLICNDHSTDNSIQLLKEFVKDHKHFRLLDLPKGGKAGALWGGIQQAKYPLVLFTDMDQSTPITEIKKILPYFSSDYDIVIGSRGKSREGHSFLRLFGSLLFSALRNFLLQSHISDTQCGFKALKTSIAKEIFPMLAVIKNIQRKSVWRVTAYDVEMLLIAQKKGYKIKEVPVEWKNEDTSTTKGDNNARYIRESREMAKEVWRVFLNNLRGIYDQK